MKASLNAMERGAHRLGRVIEDLLLLSKVGDPNYPVIPVAVDVRRTIEEVLDLSSVAAERKSITLHLDAPAEPVVAMGDAEELDRVCANLVSNAVKYTPEGGSVTVSLHRQDDQVVLSCSDEGIGISEADQEQLFREFFRSTNPVALAEHGTGLGLTIVKRIVERHGGRVEVHSELGRGSTFTVLLQAAGDA
jgi:signal transduction histidine kinase